MSDDNISSSLYDTTKHYRLPGNIRHGSVRVVSVYLYSVVYGREERNNVRSATLYDGSLIKKGVMSGDVTLQEKFILALCCCCCCGY